MLIEELREKWAVRERGLPIDPTPHFVSNGLVIGAETVLAPADIWGRPAISKGEEARVLALLSAAYGRTMAPSVLDWIDRAGKCREQGEDCLALIHLALAGLHSLDDRRTAARRVFMADGLMKAGISPQTILEALDLDAGTTNSLQRYSQSEPRVPEGSGATSGRWVKIGTVLAGLSVDAAKFLGELAVGGVRVLAANPVTFTLGLILIPRSNNLRTEGDVPELPGLHYDWNHDETRLRLTYSGPNGVREIDAEYGADGLFRDGDRVVARLLPDQTLVIDPAEVSSDLADKDGPNLCPTPDKDKPGRGDVTGEKDKDYEDQIKLLINPDNPTPRGYGYEFLNPQTGNWVLIDDCQRQTGVRVEIKSEYDELLSYEWGEASLTKKWLDQSKRQIQASEGFPLTWIFAQQHSAEFARKLFDEEGEDGQQEIIIKTIPRMGASQ